jgi:hypothetical protein
MLARGQQRQPQHVLSARRDDDRADFAPVRAAREDHATAIDVDAGDLLDPLHLRLLRPVAKKPAKLHQRVAAERFTAGNDGYPLRPWVAIPSIMKRWSTR